LLYPRTNCPNVQLSSSLAYAILSVNDSFDVLFVFSSMLKKIAIKIKTHLCIT